MTTPVRRLRPVDPAEPGDDEGIPGALIGWIGAALVVFVAGVMIYLAGRW